MGFVFRLLNQISGKYGSQSVVASIDTKKNIFGKYSAYSHSGQKKVRLVIEEYLSNILKAGVGEVLLNCIDRDRTYLGYDLELINKLLKISSVPLVACEGARNVTDFKLAIENGASTTAVGSMFVYSKKNGGILITYPSNLKL